MQIHIKREEQNEGWIFKKPKFLLKYRVEFEPEDIQTIKDAKLDEYVLFKYQNKAVGEVTTYVRSILDGKWQTAYCSTVTTFQEAERELKSGLEGLKQGIIDYEIKGGDSEEVYKL